MELAELSASQEAYLEAIYILEHTGGAIAARVADRLGVRAPSVSGALRRLEAQALLQAGGDRALRLTPAGRRLAEQVMRRHRVLERWLVEGLGLDWARAHAEAQRMEHAVSAEVVDRLYEALGRPSACPHGNPIPGAEGLPPYGGSATLDRAPEGGRVRVVRIAEDAEEDAGNLATFDRLGLRPGCRIEVLPRRNGQVRFSAGSGPAEVAVGLAAKVWVDAEAELTR
jgi:DtxR family Mn-dependent transcriptional regulator